VKRVFLVIALAALSPLGLVAVAASPAAAAQARPMVSASGPSETLCIPAGHSGELPSAETDQGIPVYFVEATGSDVEVAGCLDGIHACRVLGNDGTTQAVECADLYAESDEAGDPGVTIVSPMIEGYCQTISTGFLVQCANVDVSFEAATPQAVSAHFTDVCGHSNGPCDAFGQGDTRNYQLGGFFQAPADCHGPGSGNEFWAVALAGATIQLPGSDKKVSSNSNLASQHAIVCF
jgi:hypothetical protein